MTQENNQIQSCQVVARHLGLMPVTGQKE